MAYESAVIQTALARLERRRANRERRQFQLERELYGKQPRLREVDLALRGTMAELALLAAGDRPVSADGPEIAAIRAKNQALQAERTRLLAALGCGPDALDDVPACPQCRDRGWTQDGKMCLCLKKLCIQEQLEALTRVMHLTPDQSFDRLRLDIYSDRAWNGGRAPRETMRRVIAACESYAQQFPNFECKNLLLSGNTGLGKTYLSGCIAREVTCRGFSVVYDTASAIFDTLAARRFARDPEEERQARKAVRRYMNCDLLILDDLGSEQDLPSARSNLYEIVNSRLQADQNTIISSNLSTQDLARRYGAQIGSRVAGRYWELTFYGDDLRLTQ